jgi:serine/threonine protein phosphatase PrpC
MAVHLTLCALSHPGRVRDHNEDAFVVADLTGGSLLQGEEGRARFEVGTRGVLLAVSDGMGGLAAGEVASALVVDSLLRTMGQSRASQPPDGVLALAAESANRDVWDAGRRRHRKMGATLTALFFQGPTAHVAEVGDSRAYLLRGGILQQVTRDQSYVQLLVDTGTLTPEEAKRSQIRNVILQAMGTQPDVSLAMGRIELRRRDCFILCSDGLSNKVSGEEIRETVLRSVDLPAACQRLVEMANRRGGEDNITVIVAGVGGDDLPVQKREETIADTIAVLREFDSPA